MSMPLATPSTEDETRSDHLSEGNDGEHCCICLDLLLDRTVIPECSHEFCFECLLTWTEQSRRCPLCTRELGPYLIHQIRSNLDFQKYYLPPRSTSPLSLQQTSEHRILNYRRDTQSRRWGRRERRAQEAADELERAIDRRRWIYQNHLYAKYVASNTFTRYRPFPTPVQFSSSQDQVSRATIFIRRELRIWPNLDIEFLTTFILSLMKAIDIRSETAVKLLAELLDMEIPYCEGNRYPNAEHFIHELYSFLRSPYKSLSAYDANVQYDIPLNDTGYSIGRTTTTGTELRRINEMSLRRHASVESNQNTQSSARTDGSDLFRSNLSTPAKSPIDFTQPGTMSLQASTTTMQNFTEHGASHSQGAQATGLTTAKGMSLQANSISHLLISDTGSSSLSNLGVQNTKGKQREYRSASAAYDLATGVSDHVDNGQKTPYLTVSKDKISHSDSTNGLSLTKTISESYKLHLEPAPCGPTIRGHDISVERASPATGRHKQCYRNPLMIAQAHLKGADNSGPGQSKHPSFNPRNKVNEILKRDVGRDDLVDTRNARSDITPVGDLPSLLTRISDSIDLLSRSGERTSLLTSNSDISGNNHRQDNLRPTTEQPLPESNNQNMRSRLLERLESEKERANQTSEAELTRSVVAAPLCSDIPRSDVVGHSVDKPQYPIETQLEEKLRSRLKLRRKLAMERQSLVQLTHQIDKSSSCECRD